MLRASRRWSDEKRLEWGAALYELRTFPGQPKKVRLDWSKIRAMTGIPTTLGEELVKEYVEHIKAVEAEREVRVVNLPLPEREKPPFPETVGELDLWARRNGVISDATYRGRV